MSGKIKISVKDFSKTPGPRRKTEGEHSAQEFMEKVLEPKLQEMDKDSSLQIKIDLDGTLGYGTSFLEEIFGGTARKRGPKFVRNRIEIISEEEPWLKDEIKKYVDDVEENS